MPVSGAPWWKTDYVVRRATFTGSRRLLRGLLRTLAFAILVAACSSSKIPSGSSRTTATPQTASAPTTMSPQSSTTTNPLTADQLTNIAFFSPTSGYGLFTRQGQVTCQAVVGSTSDGGAVFGSLTMVTSWPCASSVSVSVLAFDDHGDGFAYGPDLFVTHDSGASWTQVPQPGQVLSVEASGSSVWMVEAGCSPSTGPQTACPMQLLGSADGGRSWDPVTIPSNATLNNGFGAIAAQTWLIRLSPTSAYLASNPQLVGQTVPPTAPLWYTDDGGRSWSVRQVSCGFSAMTDAISVTSDGTLVAVCAGESSAGSQAKSAVRSTNGGVTWTPTFRCVQTSSAIASSCMANPPLSSGYLGEIDAVTANAVFLVGARSSLLVTHNGGESWMTVEPLIGDDSDGTRQVVFFNSSDGVVLGYDANNDDAATLWTTTDGGMSWHSEVPAG